MSYIGHSISLNLAQIPRIRQFSLFILLLFIMT